MATHLIADTHFGHAAIIRMCNRPFVDANGHADVRLMDETLVDAWNRTVRRDDTVIHLGDFAHRYPTEKLPQLFARLNGKKHLVCGNHDGAATRRLNWESQHDLWHVGVDGQNLVLCHYPMLEWAKIRRGALMLYGHTHGRLRGNVQSADIGVDVMGWAPVRLATIKAYMATLPLRVDPEEGDDFKTTEVPTP
jgi:calcineurin-like phosphoesterase family protein